MQQKAGRTGAAVELSHTLLNDADGNLIAALGAWMDMGGELRHEPSTDVPAGDAGSANTLSQPDER